MRRSGRAGDRLQECVELAVEAADRGVVGASGCTRATTMWCYDSTRAADGGRVSRCFPTATTCAADQDRLRNRDGWRDLGACTQSAPSTPESTAAAPPPATPASDDVPAPPDAAPPHAPQGFDRVGVLGAVSTGIGSCPQPLCALIPLAGIGRFELGYRYKWVAPVASLSIGGSPIDLPESPTTAAPNAPGDTKASLRFLDVGLGVQAFPMTRTRFDPFFRLGLAYSRVVFAVNDDAEYEEFLSRGAVVLGGGLSIYVARHFAIGPRFDVVLPFAGKLCYEVDGEPILEERCTPVRDLVDVADNTIDERAIRKALPKPWSFTVDARFVF